MTRRRYRTSVDTMASIITALVVLAFLVGVLFLATLAGRLTSEGKAERALTTLGFTDVHLQARHIWFVEARGCSDKDNARYDFTATNPAHQVVTVHVCEGWPFKGATVRG